MSDIRFIRLTCGGCDQSIRLSSEHAGKKYQCPDDACKNIGPIPSLEDLARFQTVLIPPTPEPVAESSMEQHA